MESLPLGVLPDMDLRKALESAVAARRCHAAFVVSGIGSLRPACLRLAGRAETDTLDADVEILTLAGTVSSDGSHLHASVANAEGRVFGGGMLPTAALYGQLPNFCCFCSPNGRSSAKWIRLRDLRNSLSVRKADKSRCV